MRRIEGAQILIQEVSSGLCFANKSTNAAAPRVCEWFFLRAQYSNQSCLFDLGGRGSEAGRQPNFGGLVLGCIDADFLQVNFRLKALDEIYKIYTCLFGEKRTEIENWIMKMYSKYNTEEAK